MNNDDIQRYPKHVNTEDMEEYRLQKNVDDIMKNRKPKNDTEDKTIDKIDCIFSKLLEHITDRFMRVRHILFVASLSFLIGGEVGYMVIYQYTFLESLKMHIGVITGFQSPFDPLVLHNIQFTHASPIGEIYGMIDLVITWFFFPTLIPLIIDEVQQKKRELRERLKNLEKLQWNKLRASMYEKIRQYKTNDEQLHHLKLDEPLIHDKAFQEEVDDFVERKFFD